MSILVELVSNGIDEKYNEDILEKLRVLRESIEIFSDKCMAAIMKFKIHTLGELMRIANDEKFNKDKFKETNSILLELIHKVRDI